MYNNLKFHFHFIQKTPNQKIKRGWNIMTGKKRKLTSSCDSSCDMWACNLEVMRGFWLARRTVAGWKDIEFLNCGYPRWVGLLAEPNCRRLVSQSNDEYYNLLLRWFLLNHFSISKFPFFSYLQTPCYIGLASIKAPIEPLRIALIDRDAISLFHQRKKNYFKTSTWRVGFFLFYVLLCAHPLWRMSFWSRFLYKLLLKNKLKDAISRQRTHRHKDWFN